MIDFNALRREFTGNEVQTRQGKKGMFFQYVPSNVVVDRLNEIGPENWSFEVKDSKVINEEVVVLGSLKIGDTIREGYGSCVIDENRTAGDSMKTASALALTKSASLFGIPCIFNAKQQNNSSNGYQSNYQQANNQNRNETCDDCGNPISQAEINFTKNKQQFQGKQVCRTCQANYRNFRRVQ